MMANGLGNLADKFSGLGVSEFSSSSNANNKDENGSNNSLFQVMKAVEAAEATIKQQVDENNRLRTELHKKSQELEKYKSDELIGTGPPSASTWDETAHGPYNAHHLVSSEKQSGSSNVNGAVKALPSSQAFADTSGFPQFSLPSTSFSPSRHQAEGEYDPQFNLPGRGLMPMAELNNSSGIWKQDLVLQIQKQDEEIILLRKHLADYSVKEAQIHNEKYVLEKRIAHMRLAFDQQQQDLVDAASKALSYRQDIIEENIRLTYALQAAQQERSTFVSSLLPILAEYSLQPPVPDAQSIVSNLKVLFKHLQEKLIITEAKLNESQYQLAPWRSDINPSNFAPQSPSQSIGAARTASNKNSLELVPQPEYSRGSIPVSSSNAQTITDWDLLGRHQSGLGGLVVNGQHDDLGRYSPLASRNSAGHDNPSQLSLHERDARATHFSGEETASKQVTFSDPVSRVGMDHRDTEEYQNEREPSVNWASGNTPYPSALDDPSSSYSPYLPPVLEEPSSSFSEAADDDPLPGIEQLQISGEAYPGHELQACGYSVNGTTSCNFEWVRHWEDGSVNYIEGAKQPSYRVTADDVDACLAIEVQPLDDRKRKGELVKVFANEHRKITCDPEMQNQIEKTLYSGYTSYKVSLSTGHFDIWEPATLAIKREGYSIKRSGPSGSVVAEKFLPATTVTIPYGQATEFSIIGSGGVEHLLRTEDSSTDISCSRDTIVLTMRLFIIRAGEKRKGKKRNLFFNK